jgi:16S rRNA (uracil1498-N3)-methyltransferase
MRRRFFVDEIRNGQARISGDDARHLTRVLRVEPGQRYEISDNRNVFLAEIETAHKEHVVFQTIEKLPPPAPQARIILCAALIKFDHFEWMIEKATELGVAKIVPVNAARSEHGLERAAHKRVERWRRIALEASQQSRRDHLPEIDVPVDLREALTLSAMHRFVLDEDPGAPPLATLLPDRRETTDEIAILIGPEGGWTDQERAAFQHHDGAHWTSASLGPTILRAETAAIAALSFVSLSWQIAPATTPIETAPLEAPLH